MAEVKTAKKLTGGIVAIVILALCLCITTFALVYASVSVNNNIFHTGEVKINLNDGKPVIQEHEFLFEPGMTVVKDFFIENDSTWDVFYRLYLDHVTGGLSDVLTCRPERGRLIAVPRDDAAPFPLEAMFCFACSRRLRGRAYWVFRFDDREWPVF